jgi:hypothetical protein
LIACFVTRDALSARRTQVDGHPSEIRRESLGQGTG